MIVGAGRVGHHLSRKLSFEGQEVVLVDRDETKLRRMERDLNILPVHGSGASTKVLEEAGIDKTDLFIAVTDSDEVNLVACIISKQYNVKTRIARVRNEDFYSQGSPLTEKALGIDLLISPDLAMADEIIQLSMLPAAFDVAEFAGGQVDLLGYLVHDDNPCIGLSLQEIQQQQGKYNFIIAAIIRDEKTIIPRGKDILAPGDKIYIVVRKADIHGVESIFNIISRAPKNVFIIGGGTIGTTVAKRMEGRKIEVRVVDKDPVKCQALTEKLEHAIILNCNGLEAQDLLEEGIDRADLVIAVTDSDTTNILSSLLAKHHGAKKCITTIRRPDFIPLLGKLGIDVALSPRLAAADMILKFVRGGGSIVSVATLLGTDAEVLELKVPDLERFREVPLKSLMFPSGAIIGAVVTNRLVKIPSGETILKPEDVVIIFSSKDAIHSVESFFNND